MAEKIRNIALMSAAGSGKTHALTKRFLLLYLHEYDYALDSLYAITFTNAAAFEMKNRILRYLDVLSLGCADSEPERDVIDYFGCIFPDIQKRATLKKNHLLSNFSDVHISTFHSLFASFLSSIPFAAGIMPDYKIIDEPDELLILMQSIDKVLEAAESDRRVLDMLTELIEQQETTVKTGIDELYRNLVPWMPYFKELARRESRIRDETEKRANDLVAQLRTLVEFVYEHEYAALTKSTGKFNSKLEGLLTKLSDFTTSTDLRKLEPIVKYFLADGIMNKNYVQDFVGRLRTPDDFRRLVDDTVELLHEYMMVLSDREILIHLKPITEIHKNFQEEKRRMSVLSFDDIESYTRQAMRESPETDYLYFKLGSAMNHLMIDEFQDTSFHQVEILEPVIDEITAVVPTEKSLFYVGDPYQAIFRWREGAPELFDYLKDRYPGKIDGERLSVNFRTKEEIIAFVNKILDKGDQPRLGNSGGWLRIEELGAFNNKEEGNEAVVAKTVEVVQDLVAKFGYKPDDIAVLTRTNLFASRLAKSMSEAGIHCVSRSRSSILDEPEIRFMLHMLKFLDNPQDDFSLLHVLLAPPVGMNEETVRRLKAGRKTLYMALIDYHPDWSITTRLQKILSQVFFSNPYEIIFRIMQTFEMKMSYPLAALLESALRYTNEGVNSLSSFVNWFEYHGATIEVKETHARGVEILTVHRAKGLEFEIVLIPETNWDLRQPENAQLLFSYRKDSARPDKVYWRKYGKYISGLREAERERLKKDSLNLLYVALTRAKSGVYMLGYTTPSTGLGFWLNTIKEKLDGSFPLHEIPKPEKKPAKEETKPCEVRFMEQGPVVREERTLYSPTERGVEIIEPARRKGMEFGEMIHRVLSKVGWLDNVDTETLVNTLVDYARDTCARTRDDEALIEHQLLPLLKETLLDPDLRFIFYRENRDLTYKNEIAIYFEDEKKDVSGLIDRLLVGVSEILIIDYKTGTEKPEYRHQMRVYKKGIEQIHPDKRIRTILLYLDRERGTKIQEV